MLPTSDKPLLHKRQTRLGSPVHLHKTPGTKHSKHHFRVHPVQSNGAPAPLSAQQNPLPHPVLDYILGEMKTNAASDLVKKIRELNGTHAFKDALAELNKHNFFWQLLFGQATLDSAIDADVAARAAAKVDWACAVMDARGAAIGCGMWDHKPKIRAKWGVAQLIDFTVIGKPEKINFYYDIWSNIHYGYVGRAAGFSEETLISGADIENVVSNTGTSEPTSDTVSIQIGMDLYKEGNLSVSALLKKLYEHKAQLFRYDPTRPQKERTYTSDH